MYSRTSQGGVSPSPQPTRPLVNVLEEMVMQEVTRQLGRLPDSQKDKIDAVDVAGYVLNRMQPMYATNRNGWSFQREKALVRASQDISKLVTQGIEAVKRSPNRQRPPLPQTLKSEAVLNQIRELLNRPDLDWSNVMSALIELKAAADRANALSAGIPQTRPQPTDPPRDAWGYR
ncbi:MAG: late competence development ComFB family protein [Cyanobacteriota bacterium]